MADTIYLKTGQFSASSFNTSKNDLKRAADELNTLDYYGAMVNAMYTCNGSRHRIFTAAMAEEASSLAILIERLHGKLEAYSKLLQSGPEAIRDVDSSFKGTYTNAWQRGWYSISSGVSSVYNTTVSFWGSLFRRGGQKTGGETNIARDIEDANETNSNDMPDNGTNARTGVVITNDNPNYQHQWEGDYIVPPKSNKQGSRSPEAYREVMEALDVENNIRYEERYIPYFGHVSTCCNIFVWDVLTAMDCPIPSLKYFGCGAMRDWMASDAGKDAGWVEVDQATAIEMANRGFPTVAADIRGDHVAMVAPQQGDDQGCYIAEAGWKNFNYMTINWGWGSSYNIDTEIRYFYHR